MTPTILMTKLFIPPARPKLVHRQRLINQLNAGLTTGLVLVSAPAGFGKTTLISEWIRQVNFPAAWLSLDEGDNDPIHFFTYFIAALQQIHPTISQTAKGILQSGQPEPPPPEFLMTALINEIVANPTEFILVLDDYHLIETKSIQNSLDFLLDHLPPQMHLIIATRADPNFSLSRLRARSQMIEIRAEHLRFTTQEATDFLNKIMGLNLSTLDINALGERTEGWIAGLQLAALSMQGETDVSNFISAFTGSHHYIIDYLADEVLRQRPTGTKDFLLQTSILNRLSGSLCDTVTGRKDSQIILERLEQANLFIMSLDNERRWYRYHHLFVDLLRHRLSHAQNELIPELHHRASKWFEQYGFVVESINHALAARDFERAIYLIDKSVMRKYMWSEMTTVLGWFAALPNELIRVRPWLCVLHAWVLHQSRQSEAVEPRLQDAEYAAALLTAPESNNSEQNFIASPNLPTAGEEYQMDQAQFRKLLGHIAAIRAHVAIVREEIPRATHLANQALEHLPERDSIRGFSAMVLGYASVRGGNLAKAKRAFMEAGKIGRTSDNTYMAVIAACNMGDVEVLRGRLHLAVEIYEEALHLATEQDGRQLPAAGYVYVYMGEVLREWNDLEAATDCLIKGIQLCKQVGYVGVLTGYTSLARVRQAQGDFQGAYDALQKAERLMPKSNVDPVTLRWIEDCRVRWWIARGNLEAAVAWANESGLQADGEPSFMRNIDHIILARILIAQGIQHSEKTYLNTAMELLTRLIKVADEAGWIGKSIEILVLQALILQTQGGREQALIVLERAVNLAAPHSYIRIFVDEGKLIANLLHVMADQQNGKSVSADQVDYVNKILAAFAPISPNREEATPTILPSPYPPTDTLSDRELEVLRLIAAGLKNKQIAKELFVSLNTVGYHTKNIFSKLNVNNRTQATVRAKELNLL